MTLEDKLLYGKVMDVLDQIEALADEDLGIAHVLLKRLGEEAVAIDFNLGRLVFSDALDRASNAVENELNLREGKA